MPSDPAFDVVETLARVQGDRELLNELVHLSRAESARLLLELRRCVAAGAATGLERAAHQLRGSVSIFGARTLTRVTLSLETMGREQRLDGAGPALAELERELARLDRELTEFGDTASR
jgi:HPt (histidine-containing phosphotransfer) domain-containing protein